ncbi:MAG: hypothetical protein U0491_02945 [Candidatus Saccharimonadales bacterium]
MVESERLHRDDILPEVRHLEGYLSLTAKQLEREQPADDVVIIVEGAPLANNDQFPGRALLIDEGYGSLDAHVRFTTEHEENARVEGARFIFNHYSLPIQTTIELVDYDASKTALADIPFAVIPAGSEKPTTTMRFEDLLNIIDELSQNSEEELSAMLDPRLVSSITFGEAMYYVTRALAKNAKQEKTARRNTSVEPLFLDLDSPFGERTLKLEITRVTKGNQTSMLYGLSISAKQQILDNVIDYGLLFLHDPNTRISAIHDTTGVEHTYDTEQYPPQMKQVDVTLDRISTMFSVLEQLREAKELQLVS